MGFIMMYASTIFTTGRATGTLMNNNQREDNHTGSNLFILGRANNNYKTLGTHVHKQYVCFTQINIIQAPLIHGQDANSTTETMRGSRKTNCLGIHFY